MYNATPGVHSTTLFPSSQDSSTIVDSPSTRCVCLVPNWSKRDPKGVGELWEISSWEVAHLKTKWGGSVVGGKWWLWGERSFCDEQMSTKVGGLSTNQ